MQAQLSLDAHLMCVELYYSSEITQTQEHDSTFMRSLAMVSDALKVDTVLKAVPHCVRRLIIVPHGPLMAVGISLWLCVCARAFMRTTCIFKLNTAVEATDSKKTHQLPIHLLPLNNSKDKLNVTRSDSSAAECAGSASFSDILLLDRLLIKKR
jgi:hypothetical protein